MALVIDNPETVAELQRRSSASGKTIDEIIKDALRVSPEDRYGPLTEAQKQSAVRALRDLQDAFREHRDPSDRRTADEVIGYDESGLPG